MSVLSRVISASMRRPSVLLRRLKFCGKNICCRSAFRLQLDSGHNFEDVAWVVFDEAHFISDKGCSSPFCKHRLQIVAEFGKNVSCFCRTQSTVCFYQHLFQMQPSWLVSVVHFWKQFCPEWIVSVRKRPCFVISTLRRHIPIQYFTLKSGEATMKEIHRVRCHITIANSC